MLVKIMQVFERDEYSFELRVKDTSDQMWLLYVHKIKLQESGQI